MGDTQSHYTGTTCYFALQSQDMPVFEIGK